MPEEIPVNPCADASFILRYTMETGLKPDEPTDDLSKYTAELVPLIGEDCDPGEPLGHFSIWRFNIGAYQERGWPSLFLLFDDDSEEAVDLYEALLDPEREEFREEVLGDITFGLDILYFQTAAFGDNMRRDPLLLAAAERIIQTIGAGCACAALWLGDEPYPKRVDASTEDMLRFWEAQRDNERFWSRVGFMRVPGTLFLARNLALRQPISDDEFLGRGPSSN